MTSLLDFLLPSFLPSPRDFARRRFRRRWMALIERVIAERRAMPRETAWDDLFDLLSAAGDPRPPAPISSQDQQLSRSGC